MRAIFGLVLLAGLALAGVAVYLAQGFVAETQAQQAALEAERAKFPDLVDVVVAKRPLAFGERFTEADLEIIKVQAGKVPTGAFSVISGTLEEGQPKPVFAQGETRPRAAMRNYLANEALVLSRVTEPGVDVGITAQLSPTMRAFTIRVDVTSGVSGFLRPGDRVDIYWTGQSEGKDISKLIQSGVKLIAIDQNSDADRSEETLVAETVTAEVTPEQAAALSLAQTAGRLTLSLMGAADTAAVTPVEIDRNALLGVAAPAAAAAPVAARVCTIKVNKGGEKVETEIPCSN